MMESFSRFAPLFAVALAGCASVGASNPVNLGEAKLTYLDGRAAGIARLERRGGEVSLRLDLSGADIGAHGFHLHAVGKCEAPGFTSAGGHLNPSGRKHGKLATGGSHLGDLDNLEVGANGSGSAMQFIPGGSAALADIFDRDGTAIVIHAQPDDYRTDPTGNAGGRIACGVMRKIG